MCTRLAVFALVLLLPTSYVATSQPLPVAQQLTTAVAPLPEEFREGARVLGYDAKGTLIELRAGENGLTCIADEPGDARFHVACYHNALEPFMERGRRLRAEGKTPEEILAMREAEIEEGSIRMPAQPAALYSLTGAADAFDARTGSLEDVAKLYVVYMPYATEESTGLSSVPAAGKPWLMNPGKPWAHIMLAIPEESTAER